MPDANGKLTPSENAELADLMIALGKSPKARKDVAKLVRQHADDPRVKKFVESFSDVTDENPPAEDRPLTQRQLDARLAEDEGRRLAAAAQRERGSQRQELVESGRYTDDAVKGLDKFIADNGYENLSYAQASVLYAHENPPTNPRPTIGSSKQWTMPGDAEWRKDPKKTALNEAYKIVDELRGTRRA